MIELAKRHIDVGLYTNNEAAMLAFWGHSVGLPHEQTIELQWPARQQIFGANGTCVRVNAVRDPMEPTPPGGYRRLLIARQGLEEITELADPDGNLVTLVPPGTDQITSVMLELAVRDEDEFNISISTQSVSRRSVRTRFAVAIPCCGSTRRRMPSIQRSTSALRGIDTSP